MLTYPNISRILLLIELLLGILAFVFSFSFWYLLIPFAAYVLFLVDGAIHIQRNFYFKSENSLSDKNAVLLTFDDGPHPDFTPQILDLLDQYNRKALFFLIGKNAEKYPDLVRLIVSKGHQIGNHSYSHHALFDLFSARKMYEEIEQTNKLLEKLSSQKTLYFRPPYGVTNPTLKNAYKKSGLKSIGWTFRSFDTGKKSGREIAKLIQKKIRGGEILLFHDNRERSVETLKIALPYLAKFKQGKITDEDIV